MLQKLLLKVNIVGIKSRAKVHMVALTIRQKYLVPDCECVFVPLGAANKVLQGKVRMLQFSGELCPSELGLQ